MTRRSFAVLLLVVALPLIGGTAGQPDTAELLAHLNKTTRLLADAVDGLTPEQWKFTAGAGRWSIAQCTEHLALSEDFLRETAEQVMKLPPATPEQKKAVRGNEAKIAQILPDRSQKFQAPPPVQPTGGNSPEKVFARFSASRAKTVALVEASRGDLRNHVGDHPAFQQIDAYQSVLFLSAHVERHVAQIEEVKTHADYPR